MPKRNRQQNKRGPTCQRRGSDRGRVQEMPVRSPAPLLVGLRSVLSERRRRYQSRPLK